MVNPERFEIELTAAPGRSGGPWTYRLGLTGLAKLQKIIQRETGRRPPIPELSALVEELSRGDGDFDLEMLLFVLLAGLQEFHSREIRTLGDVENVIQACGGVGELARQLNGISEEMRPDPEEEKRRKEAEADPQPAQA